MTCKNQDCRERHECRICGERLDCRLTDELHTHLLCGRRK